MPHPANVTWCAEVTIIALASPWKKTNKKPPPHKTKRDTQSNECLKGSTSSSSSPQRDKVSGSGHQDGENLET